METKELTEQELAKITGGATARGESGVGVVQGGIERPQQPIDPPFPKPWTLLGQIR